MSTRAYGVSQQLSINQAVWLFVAPSLSVIHWHPSTRPTAAQSRCLLVARDRSCLTSLGSLAAIAPGLVY